MIKNLQKCLLTAAITVAGLNQANAQYAGTAYQGNIPAIGVTAGVGTVVEFENYDALASDPTGSGLNNGSADFPANPVSATGTFYDTTPGGGTQTEDVRNSTEVDTFRDDGVGVTMVNNQKEGEYVLYTVDVKTAGTYSMVVNYRAGGGDKKYKAYIHPTSLASEKLIAEATLDSTRDENNVAQFIDSPAIENIELEAGVQVIRILFGASSGWGANSFTLTLKPSLSTSDNNLQAKELKVFPNPSANGIFSLNTTTNEAWEVFNIIGKRLLKGNGNEIDLSKFKAGSYILKTSAGNKIIIFQ